MGNIDDAAGNGHDTSEQVCQNGCRWNITIKENRCKTNDTDNFCNGNGKCTSLDNEDQFSCKCFDGFGGSVCETNNAEGDNLSVCSDSNCRNGGTCVTEDSVISSTNISSSSCLCQSHFTGQYCETILNNCKSSPCVNGVCVEHIDGYQCYCVPGFHGKNCELEYNECLSNPCSNRGTCIDRVDKFECRCSVGYHGVTCQDKVDFCQPSPCHKNSTCTSIHETFACICHHGFTGKFCDERIKSCSSNPCKNHGTCIEYETGYQCMCQVTFAGQHCEYMMDVFAPPMEGADLSGESHKHNMYIVAGTLGSMVLIVVSVIVACYCKVYETYKQLMWKRLRYHRKRSNSCPDLETCNEPNYIGKHRLSADAIWEATSLCHENAAFENSANHQTFTSMQSNGHDTSEKECQNGCRWNITIMVNRCTTNDTDNICNGNGKCTSLDNENQFSCKCLNGFGGSVCEINYAEGDSSSVCTDSNCGNGGTCVTDESVISSTNISSSSCLCPSHFTGQYCETILNNCKSSPCVNGVCVEHIDGYQCYCVPGFHGKNCELEYNECLSNPCSNRGTCIDRVDKFECRCSVGYHGGTCQDKNKSCSSNPCKNHGTCIEYETGYQCMCQVTFAGQHCEYMMDVFAPPMEGADLSGESHKHNMYIVAGTLGSMVLIVVSVIVAMKRTLFWNIFNIDSNMNGYQKRLFVKTLILTT
ncbi:fibropellin-1-like [Ruditapes philippinarum]|uniref:fibropellin-1-like n=1 Tax=Ruditapes philippinarum TaxID=129788 RepID=UPI00295B104E|nr:fibropellin-1-like [Ruditapes philippinarum]